MTETELAAVALTYAHAGLKVFPLWWLVPADPDGEGQGLTLRCACPRGADRDPKRRCKSPGKHPAIPPAHRRGEAPGCRGECGRRGHGVWDATDDPGVITRWWRFAPFAHIGMPADANGLAIIDVDPRHGGDDHIIRLRTWMADRGEGWPRTVDQITGSGGVHHLFTAPPGGIPSKSKAFGADLPGLDTRGRGGYIVAAPSQHVTGGWYRWVNFLDDPPPWPTVLDQLVNVHPHQVAKVRNAKARALGLPRRGQLPDGADPWPGTSRWVAAAVFGELEVLRTTRQGERNSQLNTAAYRLGRFVGGGLFDRSTAYRELFSAGLSAGLDEAEMPKTINSGLDKGEGLPVTAPGQGRAGG